MICIIDGRAELLRVDIPTIQAECTGTGDLFAALLLAWMHRHPTDFKVPNLINANVI